MIQQQSAYLSLSPEEAEAKTEITTTNAAVISTAPSQSTPEIHIVQVDAMMGDTQDKKQLCGQKRKRKTEK